MTENVEFQNSALNVMFDMAIIASIPKARTRWGKT
jgi:hypothetical protein